MKKNNRGLDLFPVLLLLLRLLFLSLLGFSTFARAIAPAPAPASASASASTPEPSFSQLCQGEFLSEREGMCFCQSLQNFIDPFASLPIKDCNYVGELLKYCKGTGLKIISGKCFCLPTQQYIFPEKGLIGYDHQSDPRMVALPKMRKCLSSGNIPWLQTLIPQAAGSGCKDKDKKGGAGCPDSQNVEDNDFPIDKTFRGRTIQVAAQSKGFHGGRLFHITKIQGEKEWYDMRDVPGQQGDPRFGAVVLGPVLGPFFGMKSLDNGQTFTISTVKEIQGAIEAYNKARSKKAGEEIKEIEEIKVGFYAAPEGQVSVRSYLQNFHDRLSLPIATVSPDGDGTFLFHDTNFHVAGHLLIPNHLHQMVQKQVHFLLEFEKFLQRKYADLYRDPQIKFQLLKILEKKVEDIDYGTGNITLFLFRKTMDKKPWADPDFSVLRTSYLGDTWSPKEYFHKVTQTLSHIHNPNLKKAFQGAVSSYAASLESDQDFSQTLPPTRRELSEIRKDFETRKRNLEQNIPSSSS